jgi:outer membrane protein assembly factor BamB
LGELTRGTTLVLRRFAALASATMLAGAAALTTMSCGSTDSWVDAVPAPGWPAPYADAANSSYTPTAGAAALSLSCTRSAKGTLGAAVALGSSGYLAANAQTAGGCSLMVWENDNNGRQRWCTRLVQGGGFAGPLFDRFDNLYVGQPGLILSYPPTQWIRWRFQVIGMPLTPRLLGDSRLLVVTHLGQMLVFDAHRGVVVGNPIDLVADIDPTDSQRGLADCAPAGPNCPIAAAPAFSAASATIVMGIWQPGAPRAGLLALRYHPGQTPLLSREWASDAVTDGVLSSPVLSEDGATVYVNGRNRALWALNSSDGTVKWSVPLDFLPQTPPSVAPGGFIVAGGGPGTTLTAVKDHGDHAEVVWRRGDVTPLTTASQAGPGIAYTVTRDDVAGMALLAFSPADGSTVNAYPLPNATGSPVGVSIGTDRRVVVATSDGQVYGFAPAG